MMRSWQTLQSVIEARSVPEPNTGCFLWTGATRKGYGVVKFRQKFYATHRVAYELAYGSFLEELYVCHSCDTPQCNNPKHLFLGDAHSNMQDMADKKRHPLLNSESQRGEKNGNAWLTEQQAQAIALIPKGTPGVAKAYGVSPSTLYLIRKGAIWR